MLKNELSGFSIGNKVVKGSCVDPAHAWKIGCDREENGHVADGRWDESHFSQINTNRYNTTLYWQGSHVFLTHVSLTFGLNNLVLSCR